VLSRQPTYTYITNGYGTYVKTLNGYMDVVRGYQAVTQTQTVQASNGTNTLSFGPGISVADIQVEASGNDLIIGLRDPNNPNATFAQLIDKIRIQNWINPLNQVQSFKFADGTTIGVAEIIAIENGKVIAPPTLSLHSVTGNAGTAIPLSIVSAVGSTD